MTYTIYSCLKCGEQYTIKDSNKSFDCETCCGIKMEIETYDDLISMLRKNLKY